MKKESRNPNDKKATVGALTSSFVIRH